MKTLLIVYHSMTGGTLQMAQAAAAGAGSEAALQVSLLRAEDAGAAEVLGVEAFGFVLWRNAQPDELIDDEQQYQRAHNRDAPGKANAGSLVEYLAPMSVERACGDRRCRRHFCRRLR